MQPPLYSREAAEYLGICVDTLMKLQRDGEVRGFKIGWRWKFDVRDLEDFKERGKAEIERATAAARAPRRRSVSRPMTDAETKAVFKEIMRQHRENYYASLKKG